MKNLKITFAALLCAVLLSSCAQLNSVSLTQIPAKRENQIKVEKSKFIILGFNFDNDIVEEVANDLKSKCPNGKVSGVLTKDENINYFLYLFWSKKITVTGYCN